MIILVLPGLDSDKKYQFILSHVNDTKCHKMLEIRGAFKMAVIHSGSGAAYTIINKTVRANCCQIKTTPVSEIS